MLNIIKTSYRENFISLSISKLNAALTQSVFSFSLSFCKTGLRLSGRSLSFGKRDTSFKGLGLKIAERIDSQAVGISTGGLSKIVLNTGPNFLKESFTLGKVSFSNGPTEFCVDFIKFSTESLRQGVGFRCRPRKLEQRILIILALSFSKSLDTLSILESNIGVSIFHLTIEHNVLND